jgi:hypothetical protein
MNDTTTRPPRLDPLGHVRLTDQRRAGMGGHATLTLAGTTSGPRLYADTPDSFSGVSLFPDRDDLIRWAREVLVFLGEDYGITLPPWHPASSGAGKRHWFLIRDMGKDIPVEDRYYYGANGNLVRYASCESAQRAADKLNAAEQHTAPESGADTGMTAGAIAEILGTYYERWSRAGRLDEQLFRDLANRLLPLVPGEVVQFQEPGRTRWFNGTFDGPVDNPDDPQRSGDVVVLSRSGRRVSVFISGVRRRP